MPSGECGSLVIETITADDRVSGAALSAYDVTSASLKRLGIVYSVAGLAYAVILCLPWMITADGGFPLPRFIWLVVCYAWPVVLTLQLVAVASRRGRLWIAGIYLLLVIFSATLALVRNPVLDVGQLLFFWLFANAAGTLLLAAFLTRRIRAVGSLVLAFVVVGVTGAFLAVTLAGSDEGLLRAIATMGGVIGLNATALFALLHLVGFAVFG